MPRTQNTLRGSDGGSHVMMQGKSKMQAKQAAATSRNTASKGTPVPTPITVSRKKANVPAPSPMEILAAPQGKMK